MMRLLINLILLSFPMTIQSQSSGNYLLNFEDEYGVENLYIDTISNKNNIWEIGVPTKNKFDSAFSVPNAICTDLNSPYPINDTSSFYIHNTADIGFLQSHSVFLSGRYQIDTDTLSDYGILEFSPDNGTTWINLINDTIYRELNCYWWWPEIPVFTGKSEGWEHFNVWLAGFGSYFDIGSLYDTVIYRFSFISDSLQTMKDGWMLDDLYFEDWAEVINSKTIQSFESNVFPTPASESIFISYTNNSKLVCNLFIYDINGALLLSRNSTDDIIEINISSFIPGTYFYRLTLLNEMSIGKIIKN